MTTDLSPKSMAEAAYEYAVAKMDQRGKNGGEEVELTREDDAPNDGGIVAIAGSATNDNDAGRESDIGARIKEIWQSGNEADANFDQTLGLLVGELDSLVQCGLGAFYELDATSRQLAQSKELVETKSREAKRLAAIDEQSRASLSSLLRAVESSKAEAREGSRSAQLEARLRAEIIALRDERDSANTELSDKKRKHSLLEEELRLTKSKLNRVMQEKVNMERDSRAAISLARSLDNNNSNDMNYYKRKVGELSDKIQSQRDLIAKQNGTIAELRGQNERSRKSY